MLYFLKVCSWFPFPLPCAYVSTFSHNLLDLGKITYYLFFRCTGDLLIWVYCKCEAKAGISKLSLPIVVEFISIHEIICIKKKMMTKEELAF